MRRFLLTLILLPSFVIGLGREVSAVATLPRYDNPGQGLFQCHANNEIGLNYVKGGGVIVYWGKLQPDNASEFDRNELNKLINEIKKDGKKTYLQFMIYLGGEGSIYPPWLKVTNTKIDGPSAFYTVPKTEDDLMGMIPMMERYLNGVPLWSFYPQPWDSRYHERLEKFLGLLNDELEKAGVLDYIEYVEPSLGGQWGCTNLWFPIPSGETTPPRLRLFAKAAGCGETDWACLGRKFNQGVDKIIDIYSNSFPKMPLMLIGGSCRYSDCSYNGFSKMVDKYGMRIMYKNAGLGAHDATCGFRDYEFNPLCKGENVRTKCGQEPTGSGMSCGGAFNDPASICAKNTLHEIDSSDAVYDKTYQESFRRERVSYYCMYSGDLGCGVYQDTNKMVADKLGAQVAIMMSDLKTERVNVGGDINIDITWKNSGIARLIAPLKQGLKWTASSYKLFVEFEKAGVVRGYGEFDISPSTKLWQLGKEVSTSFRVAVPDDLGGDSNDAETSYRVYVGLTDLNGEKKRFVLTNNDSFNEVGKRRYKLAKSLVVVGKRGEVPTSAPTSAPEPTEPVLSGDADGDGDVDGSDFVIWGAEFLQFKGWQVDHGSQAGNGSVWQADFNGDGRVTMADFVLWRRGFI